MIVRELIKQLLDFNPEIEIDTVLDNGKSTKFSLGWSAPDSSNSEGFNSKILTEHVSIHVNNSIDKFK